MRTWTIAQLVGDALEDRKGILLPSGLRVIELRPVLDLLEDLKTDMRTVALWGHGGCDGTAEDAANNLLKAHGRLSPVASTDKRGAR